MIPVWGWILIGVGGVVVLVGIFTLITRWASKQYRRSVGTFPSETIRVTTFVNGTYITESRKVSRRVAAMLREMKPRMLQDARTGKDTAYHSKLIDNLERDIKQHGPRSPSYHRAMVAPAPSGTSVWASSSDASSSTSRAPGRVSVASHRGQRRTGGSMYHPARVSASLSSGRVWVFHVASGVAPSRRLGPVDLAAPGSGDGTLLTSDQRSWFERLQRDIRASCRDEDAAEGRLAPLNSRLQRDFDRTYGGAQMTRLPSLFDVYADG